MAYLTVRIKDMEGYRFEVLPESGGVVLGRADECEIRLRADAVSRQHARMDFRDGGWRISDLGSSNGVRIDGEAISEEQILGDGMVVRLGKARLTFHLGEPPGTSRLSTSVAPFHRQKPQDPDEACTCPSCGTWLAIGHHEPGDPCTCPRCDHRFPTPQLVPAPPEQT
ncbi:MAG: FHA domain-containing protein [Planctomycetota bacterium]